MNGIFALIGLVVVLAIVGLAARGPARGSKQCPKCGAYCPADAGVCRHCGYAWAA